MEGSPGSLPGLCFGPPELEELEEKEPRGFRSSGSLPPSTGTSVSSEARLGPASHGWGCEGANTSSLAGSVSGRGVRKRPPTLDRNMRSPVARPARRQRFGGYADDGIRVFCPVASQSMHDPALCSGWPPRPCATTWMITSQGSASALRLRLTWTNTTWNLAAFVGFWCGASNGTHPGCRPTARAEVAPPCRWRK